RDRDAPQGRVVPEERVGLLADPRPEALALSRVDELAADFCFRRGDRGGGAREAHAELSSGPGARADRQGLAAPAVELLDRFVLGQLEPERRLGRWERQRLEGHLQDASEGPE